MSGLEAANEDTFDMTITSPTDNPEAVKAVAEGREVTNEMRQQPGAAASSQQTEEEPAKKPADKSTEPPVAADAALDPDLVAELDKIAPPPAGETPEQKQQRYTRAQKDVIKHWAGRKNAESALATTTAENARLKAENETLKASSGKPATQTPPPAGDKAGDQSAAAQTAFTFPEYEDWERQSGNEDKSPSQYYVALTDARFKWNEDQKAVVAQKASEDAENERVAAAIKANQSEFQAGVAALKQTEPDYDEVVAAAQLPERVFVVLDQHVTSLKGKGAAVLSYVARHQDVLDELAAATSPQDVLVTLGVVRARMDADAKAAADAGTNGNPPKAKTPPSEPVSRAPKPAEQIQGSSTAPMSLADLAAAGDADGYMRERDRLAREGVHA